MTASEGKSRILIVESDMVRRLHIISGAGPPGYTVSSAGSAFMAVGQVDLHSPEIVIVSAGVDDRALLGDRDFRRRYKRRGDTSEFSAALGLSIAVYDRLPGDPYQFPEPRPRPNPALTAGAMAAIPAGPPDLDLGGRSAPESD